MPESISDGASRTTIMSFSLDQKNRHYLDFGHYCEDPHFYLSPSRSRKFPLRRPLFPLSAWPRPRPPRPRFSRLRLSLSINHCVLLELENFSKDIKFDLEITCLRAFIPQRMKVWAFQILTLYSSNFVIGGEDPYDSIGRAKKLLRGFVRLNFNQKIITMIRSSWVCSHNRRLLIFINAFRAVYGKYLHLHLLQDL